MPYLSSAAPAQIAEILDETFSLWGEGLDRAGYERYNQAQRKTAWGSRHLDRLVLTDGSHWLSTAKRYGLRGRVDGRSVRILGIGAVFTPPRFRRRGFAGELIRQMLGQADDEGFDLALLFSEIGTGFYEELGFVGLPLRQLSLRCAPMPGPPAVPLRSGDARDLAAIAEMNRRQVEGFRFGMARDEEYIAYAIAKKRLLAANGPLGRRHVEWVVVEEGGRAAAYIVLLEVGDYWMITECGDLDPSGARVGAALQALLWQRREHHPVVRAWLPPNFLPPQATILSRELPGLAMMVRPVGGRPALTPPLADGDLAWWHADAF